MEIEYDRDILPFRENDPEMEVFDCYLCHEPVSEEEAIPIQTDTHNYAHKECIKKHDPYWFWMSRL